MKQGDLFADLPGDAEPRPKSRPKPRPESRTEPRAESRSAEEASSRAPAKAAQASSSPSIAEGPGDAADRRRAVTSFDEPILLEAGAGTGKTATLVARVVHWCLGPGWERAERAASEAPDPERTALEALRGLAAITFTEAAAAEMSTRVAEALARIQHATAEGELREDELPKGLAIDALPGDAGVLHERARALRSALDHLNISTIHAFCRRLLAAHPLEVGLDPAFEVDATFSNVEIVAREVLERYLRAAWSEPIETDLIELAGHRVGPPEIERALIDLVDGGARAEDFDGEPFDEATCRELVEALRERGAVLAELGAPLVGSTHSTRFSVEALAQTNDLCAQLSGSPREQLDALCTGVSEVWDEPAQKRLKEWRRGRLLKGESNALGTQVETFVAAAVDYAEALEPFAELQPALLECALRVMRRLLADVQAELGRRGVATFNDLLVGARRLLRDHPDVARRERRKLRQLFVDEFQDTDEVQCDIVASLALEGEQDERPGLFLVGDPKQSIFAWRNADLGAYDRFADRVQAEGGVRLSLTRNFRSLPGVLDEVELAVSPVMEEVHGVQPPFAQLEAERASVSEPAPASIEYWVSWPRTSDGGIEAKLSTRKAPSYAAEARAVARDIAERASAGGHRWSEFALVLRAFTHIEPYLEALRENGVPYEVQSDRKYYQRREVIDATALVRAALDPNDQLALVTLLRSPMVGVPDAALLPLWEAGFPGRMARLYSPAETKLEELEACVRAAAEKVPSPLPGLNREPASVAAAFESWSESLLGAIRSLAALRGSFRTESADVWVDRLRAHFLPDAVEAARFLGAYRLANLERFFRDLLSALEDRAGDAQSILRTLRGNLARDDRSEASRPSDSGQDVVQVLTIHGAKGLEFGNVYVAQLHKGEMRGERYMETVFDRRGDDVAFQLFGSPNPAWFRTKRRREEAESAERVRLLYVAMTRARDRLVMLGAWPTNNKSPKGWRQAGHFVDLLSWRAHARDAVSELKARAALGKPEPWGDPTGAMWYLAVQIDDGGGERSAEALESPPPALAEPRVVAAESAALLRDADAARVRMGRAFHGVASEEGHADFAESRAGRRFDPGEPARPAIGREAAQAAGTAVHRVLELFDLNGDPQRELERWVERLETLLRELVSPEEQATAAERARDLCQRMQANGLLERFGALREHVVARELPVLLPCDAEDGDEAETAGPVGYVSGAIDLCYRDPSSDELVVVDYKTDAVDTDAELAQRVALYRTQASTYAKAVRGALALDRTPRAELWFLHSGRVETLPPERP